MLTNFNSPPVTKPTTCLTPQDNQSMEISQTTHEYTHTHIHGHCMVQKQIALLNVRLYFSTQSCEISESSRLKYQSNGGECGSSITLLHMHRHFASGLIDNETILHLDVKPVFLNSLAMALIPRKFSAMIEGNTLCGCRNPSPSPMKGWLCSFSNA